MPGPTDLFGTNCYCLATNYFFNLDAGIFWCITSSLVKARKGQTHTEEIFDLCNQTEDNLALSGGSNLPVFFSERTILTWARQNQLPTLPNIFLVCTSTDTLNRILV